VQVGVVCMQFCMSVSNTRNSSGDEIANVNFLYDDIVHMIQNTIDSCINSATARRSGYVLEHMFTKFNEITQCNFNRLPALSLHYSRYNISCSTCCCHSTAAGVSQ